MGDAQKRSSKIRTDRIGVSQRRRDQLKGKTSLKGRTAASNHTFTVSAVLYNANHRTPGPFTANIPAAPLTVDLATPNWMQALADSAWAAFTPDLALVFVHMREVTKFINVFSFPYTRHDKWAYFSLDGSRATQEQLEEAIRGYVPSKRAGMKPFKLPLYLNLSILSATLPPLVKIPGRPGRPKRKGKSTEVEPESEGDVDESDEYDEYEDAGQDEPEGLFQEVVPDDDVVVCQDDFLPDIPHLTTQDPPAEPRAKPPIDPPQDRTGLLTTREPVNQPTPSIAIATRTAYPSTSTADDGLFRLEDHQAVTFEGE